MPAAFFAREARQNEESTGDGKIPRLLATSRMLIPTSGYIRNECSRNGIYTRGKWFRMPKKGWQFRPGLTCHESLLLLLGFVLLCLRFDTQ